MAVLTRDRRDSLSHLSTTAHGEFVISVHRRENTASGKIKIDRLGADGLRAITLQGSDEVVWSENLLSGGSDTNSPILAWIGNAGVTLHINVLGSERVTTVDLPGLTQLESVKIHSPPQHSSISHFLIHYQMKTSHHAEIYKVDLTSQMVVKAFDLASVPGRGAFSASVTSSGVSFTRFTETDITLFSSTSSEKIGQWSMPEVNNPDKSETVFPQHAQSEVIIRSGASPAVRSAVLLSNGDWVLVKNGDAVWYRPESLAGIVAAEWADFWTPEPLLHELEVEEQTDFLHSLTHRMLRHVRRLSQAALRLGTFRGLGMADVLSFGTGRKSNLETNDAFGFSKAVVVATDNGRLIALDTGNHGIPLFNVKAVDLLRGQRWSKEAVGSVTGRLADLRIPIARGNTIGTTDPSISSNFTATTSSQLPSSKDVTELSSYSLKDGTLMGLRNGQLSWQFVPKSSDRIHSVTASLADEPVASIGKVLGDRRVLYKYQNPNLILVITANDEIGVITTHLIDGISGAVLHASDLDGVDTSRPIATVVSENWFAHSFTTDTIDEAVSKGYQLVVAELYESELPNDRGTLGSSSDFSSVRAQLARPHVVKQVFHVPEEISTMAVTQTRQGITSRDLLVGLPGTSAIVAIPRQAIDPRRTVGSDPTAAQAMEEGLTRYSPMIDFDAKWHVTHRQEVWGVRGIMASPARLESTSLVFAHGLDVFGTRVAPSSAFDVLGDSFNKVQLVLTVVALTAAAFAVAPLVQRKQTNALWQST